ncbi:MAG: hypothetical protein P857_352 [Candidatus Xenolissoclinum pacificiensis L6]|uniref:Uncharacterized protein n=1 Tax=Candidatus Xenolissoclinum pacificiensis L6 TaxID=1401685 RepID=W2V197_9RICK|nr:MAG: hypothetical protein P857_352 [Candidatus Xenolissoclinum pacificiensis L6]
MSNFDNIILLKINHIFEVLLSDKYYRYIIFYGGRSSKIWDK